MQIYIIIINHFSPPVNGIAYNIYTFIHVYTLIRETEFFFCPTVRLLAAGLFFEISSKSLYLFTDLCYHIKVKFDIQENKDLKTLLWCKKILTQACVIYTFFVTAVYLLGNAVDSHMIPTLSMVLALLVFSVALSAANAFLFSDKLIFALRLIIHYTVTTVVFYVAFAVWGGYKDNGGSVLSIILIYTFAYVICAIIVGVYRWLTAEFRTAHTEYNSIFNKDNGENK